MRSPEDIVQAQINAYNAQDMEAFLDCFHPDAEFVRWPSETLHRGHAEFRLRYGELWNRSPRLKAQILQRMVVGRFVTDLEQLIDHADGQMPPLLVIYETADGLIRRFHVIRSST